MPSGKSHDEYLELCALATTEWLSAPERKRLDDHLAECSDCREALRQYQALMASGIPAADFGAMDESGRDRESAAFLDEAEAALFARLKREESSSAASQRPGFREMPASSGSSLRSREPASPADTPWRHIWWQYAAGLILTLALGYSVYRAGIYRGAETAKFTIMPARESADSSHIRSAGVTAPIEGNVAAFHQRDAQVVQLRAEIRKDSALIAQLSADKAKLQQNLSSADASNGTLAEARADLARQLATAQAQLRDAHQRLDAVGAQNATEEEKVAALREQIADLNAGLEQRDQELAREQELLDHDSDIRDLMGSRSLYIAEVYDVAKNGQTQVPFGRVFYTKGKSLIFYAYDLDQQPGLRESSTFQAWGSRGPGESHAVSLGVFYVDNAAGKRWVLKADNPKTLTDIDAVFVTVEPHGGSTHPSGKPLLFAYLKIEPNHP